MRRRRGWRGTCGRLAALVAAGLALAAGPLSPSAGAHACSIPLEVPVDRPSRVDVSVTAEAVPVVGVDVAVPDGYRLEGTQEQPGWSVTVDGGTVHYTAGTMEPYSCAPFSLTGVATDAGELTFPVTVHHADGTTARYEGDDAEDHGGAQVVFAVAPGGSTGSDGGGGGGLSPWVGVGAAGVLVAAGSTLVSRRRAGRPA